MKIAAIQMAAADSRSGNANSPPQPHSHTHSRKQIHPDYIQKRMLPDSHIYIHTLARSHPHRAALTFCNPHERTDPSVRVVDDRDHTSRRRRHRVIVYTWRGERGGRGGGSNVSNRTVLHHPSHPLVPVCAHLTVLAHGAPLSSASVKHALAHMQGGLTHTHTHTRSSNYWGGKNRRMRMSA
jgi:hypothetical protein